MQIVDARNPLRFRCDDLEAYVADVEGAEGEQGTGKDKRRNLLLINKADLLTAKQRCTSLLRMLLQMYLSGHHRRLWADYFDAQGITYAFFSAANAAALQEARREALAEEKRKAEAAEEAANHLYDSDEDEDELMPSAATDDVDEEDTSDADDASSESDESEHNHYFIPTEEDTPDGQDPRARVLSVLELEDLFIKTAPELSSKLANSACDPVSSDRQLFL